MNFFKSVFAEDSPPSSPPSPDSQTLISSPSSSSAAAAAATTTATTTAWNFNGLIQTLSSKSDSLLETYRRDLQEFRVGLASETQTLKHVAATSLDVAAAKGTVSLESFGNAIDSFGSVVSEIIFNAADQISDDHSSDTPLSAAENRAIGVKYSRFESQLKAIQGDESTYLDDPIEDDGGEFEKWKLGFNLGEFDHEVEELLAKKETGVDLIYEKLVPDLIDNDTFWLRYFYRVHRLKQAEFVRARLVKRAIEADNDDEDLSWDVDDEEDDKDKDKDKDINVVVEDKVEGTVEKDEEDKIEGTVEVEKDEDDKIEGMVKKDDVEQKSDTVGSKDSDISVISSQQSSHEEEDLGWDEIEDLGSGDDEKKGASQIGSPNRAELRKRLSTAEVDDDEDLSWDIEDDDEPIKS